MLRYRSMHTLKKCDAVRAPAHNYFNHERHFVSRDICKARCSATLAGNCSRGWQKKSCAETRDLIHPTDVDRTWHWAE